MRCKAGEKVRKLKKRVFASQCFPIFAHHNVNFFQTVGWKGFLVEVHLLKGGKWMTVWELSELSGRTSYFMPAQSCKIH